MFINRGMKELEEKQVLKGLHGVAILTSAPDSMRNYKTFLYTEWDSKQGIGKVAANTAILTLFI